MLSVTAFCKETFYMGRLHHFVCPSPPPPPPPPPPQFLALFLHCESYTGSLHSGLHICRSGISTVCAVQELLRVDDGIETSWFIINYVELYATAR